MRGIFLPRSQCINTIGAGELTMQTESPEVTAFHCDVCGCCTKVPGYGNQFGLLQARWGTAPYMTASGIRCACVRSVFSWRCRICASNAVPSICSMIYRWETMSISDASVATIIGVMAKVHAGGYASRLQAH